MLTVEYPMLLPEIEAIPMGLIPIVLRKTDALPKLIVKASKETLLTAKINKGFKIYIAPIHIGSQQTYGLISAFYDTEDEPLMLYTPIFDDAVMRQLVKMIQGLRLECHCFDEHSRELLAYTCGIEVPPATRQRLIDSAILPFSMDLARASLDQMQLWFALRKAEDDREAISINFDESLMPEDIFIMDSRPENHRVTGSPTVTFSELERQEPGAFQEQDIARLLQQLFHPEHIFLNPKRVDNGEEVADLLVITDAELIVVQAKDSPNIERIMRTLIARKKKTTMGAVTKAASQVKGALRYIRSNELLSMKIDGKTMTLDTKGLEFRGLIVVKELFNDDFDQYTPLLMEVFKDSGVPCIALDYFELVSYVRGLDADGFFGAFNRVFSHGLETGMFPRLRILSPPEQEAGADDIPAGQG